jgi:DNA-directed RNA polymerase subunit RPC12/RpoP
MDKAPGIKNLMNQLSKLVGGSGNIDLEDVCTTCNNKVGTFKDELSKKEHKISGMCQNCQDRIFG